MKVLNLRCAAEHCFEGWFTSEADYLSQTEGGLLVCPLCGNHTVRRMPSAPHVWSASARAMTAPREARERAAAESTAETAVPAGAVDAIAGETASRAANKMARDATRDAASPTASAASSDSVVDRSPRAESAHAASSGVESRTLQSAWLRAVRHVIDNTDDVGTQFAEEARRIHYGEASDRAIRGTTTADEAAALQDEGIEVMAIPMPAAFKGSLQ